MPWEVGQRTPSFSTLYSTPLLPVLFGLDSIKLTESRFDELEEAEELGDPRLPEWCGGSGRKESTFGQDSLLKILYDMITAPMLSLPLTQLYFCCGLFDLSTSFLLPRKAFILDAADPLGDTLLWNNTDSQTQSAFGGTVRRAASSWDFFTAFDPVFLPLDTHGLLLRNLDPIASTGNSDEMVVVIGGESLSDSEFIPPAYGSLPVPGDVDFASGRLTAGGTGLASFLQ